MPRLLTVEDRRLEESRLRKKHWKRWGPYMSERQWGTVREDYSSGRHSVGVFSASNMRIAARIAGVKTESEESATATR